MHCGPTTFLLLPWFAFAFAETRGSSSKPCQDAVCQAEEEESAALLQAKAKVRKHLSARSSDQTDITTELNGNLQNKDRGVVVRTPDPFLGSEPKPATLWRSDVFPPNQLYLLQEKPFGLVPIVGYAMDDKKWDAIILNTFYPHDANACDPPPSDGGVGLGRCGWTGVNWECPGAWIAPDLHSIKPDPKAIGASKYKCRGCHFDSKALGDGSYIGWNVNQDFSVVDDNTRACNCPSPEVLNYDSESVCEWVQKNLADTGRMKLDPGFWGDPVTCWVNNPVAMSLLQNCYYWKYYANVGNLSNAVKEYWGWNEIGTDGAIDQPESWKALLIFLPAQLHGKSLAQLDDTTQDEVVAQLLKMEKNGQLKVGKSFLTSRPGSSVVIANEYPDKDSNWHHHFFCQRWSWGKLKVCFQAQQDDHVNKTGHCYVEWSKVPCA